MCCSDNDDEKSKNKQSNTNRKGSSKFEDVVLFGMLSFVTGSLLTIAATAVMQSRKQG